MGIGKPSKHQSGKDKFLAKQKQNVSNDKKSNKQEDYGMGGFGRFVHQTSADLNNVARHAPGGIAATGQALYSDAHRAVKHPLRESGIYQALTHGKQPRESDLVKKIIKPTIHNTVEDFKHPLRHPGYFGLDLLSLAAPVAKATGAGRLAGAGGVRTLEYSGTAKQMARFHKGTGGDFVQKNIKVQVPTSRTASGAVAQKAGDAIRRQSKTLQYRKVAKEFDRNLEIASRKTHGVSPGVKESFGSLKRARQVNKALYRELKKDKPDEHVVKELSKLRDQLPQGPVKLARQAGGVKEVGDVGGRALSEANALFRAGKLFRPGYIPANMLGANVANVIHMGAKYPGVMLKQKSMVRHGLKRDRLEAQMGGGVSEAGAGSPGTHGAQGPVATVSSGIGRTLGKATDRASRERAFIHEAGKKGYNTPEKINHLLEHGNPNELIEITRRAEDHALNFSSAPRVARDIGFSNKTADFARKNVFLARWLETSTKYVGHTALHHPVQTGVVAQLGRQAPDVAKFLGLKHVPGFMQGYIPAGHRGKMPKLLNMQGASLFDSPGEITQALVDAYKTKGGSIAQHANPVQQAVFDGTTGFNRYSGKYDNNSARKKTQALRDVIDNPYTKTAGLFPSKSFPRSEKDKILQLLFGSSFVPTPADPKFIAKLAKQQPRKHKYKKHHHKDTGF